MAIGPSSVLPIQKRGTLVVLDFPSEIGIPFFENGERDRCVWCQLNCVPSKRVQVVEELGGVSGEHERVIEETYIPDNLIGNDTYVHSPGDLFAPSTGICRRTSTRTCNDKRLQVTQWRYFNTKSRRGGGL
jgi:hypothetical protein